MGRLTDKELFDALNEHEKDCCRCRERICTYESDRYNCLQDKDKKAYKELAEYRRLEEQGLLLKLPCKVGDVVYQITRDIVSEFRIKTFVCDNKTFFFHWECIKGIYKNVVGFHSSRIGVDVFLTKEEAEKALAEMEK